MASPNGNASDDPVDQSQADLVGDQNLGKIRDILFGSQIQDYDKRFDRLEARISEEQATQKEDTRRRIDSLEEYVKGEMTSLIDRLKTEQEERVASVKETSKDIRDLTRAYEKKVSQLDEQATGHERDLREQILSQSKTLRDELDQKFDELKSALARETAALNDSKTDRSALGDLLTEVGMRLKDEIDFPKVG